MEGRRAVDRQLPWFKGPLEEFPYLMNLIWFSIFNLYKWDDENENVKCPLFDGADLIHNNSLYSYRSIYQFVSFVYKYIVRKTDSLNILET